jgi:hypothetical protein
VNKRGEKLDGVSVYLSTRLLENQGITGHLIFNIGLVAGYQDIRIIELGYSIIHGTSQKPSMRSVNIIRHYYILALLC